MKNNGLECIAESCAHCTMVQWNADNEVKCNVLKNTRKNTKIHKIRTNTRKHTGKQHCEEKDKALLCPPLCFWLQWHLMQNIKCV